MVSHSSLLQHTIDHGEEFPLRDLPCAPSSKIDRFIRDGDSFRVGRQVDDHRIRCCATLASHPLTKLEVFDVMRGASPDQSFPPAYAVVRDALVTMLKADDGSSFKKDLFHKHERAFGERWSNELLPVARRFRKYLKQVRTQHVDSFTRMEQEGADPWGWWSAPLSDGVNALRALGEDDLVHRFLSGWKFWSRWTMSARDRAHLYDPSLWENYFQLHQCVSYIQRKTSTSLDRLRERVIAPTHGLYRRVDIGGQSMMLRAGKDLHRLFRLLRRGVKTKQYQATYAATVEKCCVRVHEHVDFAPVAGAVLLWSEKPGDGDVQLDPRVMKGIVTAHGRWWGPFRSLPFDPHLGLMLAAGLSYEETVRSWPATMRLQPGGRERRIGPREALMMVLLRQRDIVRSAFFQALRKRVQKSPLL